MAQEVNMELVNNLRPFFGEYGRWALITETNVGAGGTGTVTFSSIPQNFRNLQLLLTVRTDRVAEVDSPTLIFNGDGAGNYDYNVIDAVGAILSATPGRAQTAISGGICEAGSSTASAFSSISIEIPNYTDTNTFKTVITNPHGAFGNVSADADCRIRVAFNKWRSTSAITSITVDQAFGPNFVQYCKFQLYGVL